MTVLFTTIWLLVWRVWVWRADFVHGVSLMAIKWSFSYRTSQINAQDAFCGCGQHVQRDRDSRKNHPEEPPDFWTTEASQPQSDRGTAKRATHNWQLNCLSICLAAWMRCLCLCLSVCLSFISLSLSLCLSVCLFSLHKLTAACRMSSLVVVALWLSLCSLRQY